jgi:hypothetical protein
MQKDPTVRAPRGGKKALEQEHAWSQYNAGPPQRGQQVAADRRPVQAST